MKRLLLGVFLFNANPIFSQELDSFLNSASRCVVYLSGEYMDGAKLKSVSGTGFFVVTDDFLYLITAQHVAEKMQLNQTITFVDSMSKPTKILLSKVQDTSVILWTYHPDADVAVLCIHPESDLRNYKDFRATPMNLLVDKLTPPGRYKETIAFGFPLSLGVEKYFSPISTSSKIASNLIDLKRFDNNHVASFFLLDEPSIPGLSGGPVFSLPSFLNMRDSASLIGLMHGVISDNTGGKFAAIVPSSFIVETIKKTQRYTGIYKLYHANGKLWSEHLYENGYFIEVLSNYNSSGKQQDKGTLKNGTGSVKFYDEMGKLLVTQYFKDKKFEKTEFEK